MESKEEIFKKEMGTSIDISKIIHRTIPIKEYTKERKEDKIFFNSQTNLFEKFINGKWEIIDVDRNITFLLKAAKICEQKEYIEAFIETKKAERNTIIDNYLEEELKKLRERTEEIRRETYATAVCSN